MEIACNLSTFLMFLGGNFSRKSLTESNESDRF